MTPSLETVRHWYTRLAPRDRLFLMAAAFAAALTIIVLVSGSLRSQKARLQRQIAAKERQLRELQSLRLDYLQLKRDAERVVSVAGQRSDGFSLFSFLEGVGSGAVTRERILAMVPSSRTVGDYVEESVEMKLSGVDLDQVVKLLFDVENSDTPLSVNRLTIKKRYNDPYSFDVTVLISMLKAA